MCEKQDKVEYLSSWLAWNAVWLHELAHPGCAAVNAYPCGDHWHIGHTSRRAKAECPENPLWIRRSEGMTA